MSPPCSTWVALAATFLAGAPVEGPAAADRDFAARAAQVGVNAAFLEVLAEGGVLFRPGPVDGRAWMREHADDGELLWEPGLELVSAAGDLGVTFGPFQYRRDGRTLSAGHFLSVWTRASSEAPWRLVADIGTAHAEPAEAPDYAVLAELGEGVEGQGTDAERDVRGAEAALAQAATESGAAGALLDAGHARLCVLRAGSAPALGLEAAVPLLEEHPVDAEGELERVVLADSGELAACWGRLAPRAEGGAPGGWLRIWFRERGATWKVLADVRLAPPR